jgi:two-component system, response regulator PdtaR
MKVLIVEDEAIIAIHLEMLVVEFGHEVSGIAASTDEAITLTIARRPDVVLMDIRLRFGTSGIEAARELYARHGVHCIFLSGNLDEATRTAAVPYEPIDFIGKPILPIALKRALEKADKAN